MVTEKARLHKIFNEELYGRLGAVNREIQQLTNDPNFASNEDMQIALEHLKRKRRTLSYQIGCNHKLTTINLGNRFVYTCSICNATEE